MTMQKSPRQIQHGQMTMAVRRIMLLFALLGSIAWHVECFSVLPSSLKMSARGTAAAGGAWALRRGRGAGSIATSLSAAAFDADDVKGEADAVNRSQKFDLTTALFCGGLAFDAYAEPPPDSSRWEKGSRGLNVAFQSLAYTRSLYKGLIEVTPLKITDLPDEDDTAEGLMTGSGTDAYLLVAVAEGRWAEDVQILSKEEFHDGVLSLQGCAHVGRSSTAWSNIDEKKAAHNLKNGKGGAYHIQSSWGKGGQAIFQQEPPFYLYVQDPNDARLVFTVMDDDVLGDGTPIGSTSKRLVDLIPRVDQKELVNALKEQVLAQLKEYAVSGGEDPLNNINNFPSAVQEWSGDLKLTNKPRKKDKGGQVATGAVIGAMVAGPAGAAAGGFLANMYEGQVRGKISAKLRYIPIPSNEGVKREKYKVKGGLPGVSWGELYERHILELQEEQLQYEETTNGAECDKQSKDLHLGGSDLEFCFFVNHDETGCSCAVYRSLEKRMITISFRGTCTPIDLVTDASIVQDAWVEGEDVTQKDVMKVHSGFRKSLNSISRRLKELVLAAVAPGEDLSQYDVIVTGHSLGAALATLFTTDVAEYGMDAGRSLPQLEASEPWWNSLATSFFSKGLELGAPPPPPRPKSLKMYNFGSPRVGNDAFVAKFDTLMKEGQIDSAYRIVNGEDIVARFPRTMNALVFGNVAYEHCGPTVLISQPKTKSSESDNKESIEGIDGEGNDNKLLIWVEGESDDADCPVRDGVALTSPLAQGALLGDIVSAVKKASGDDIKQVASRLGDVAEQVTGRLQKLSATDITSVVGVNKKFSEREMKIIQSFFNGDAIAHHLEDEYYQGMGLACGYIALVGEDIRPMNDLEETSA
uniref:Fungal lipase-type domain-containing protein n=1 Tax=Helicotheca tamesis TaxID=374047 RepID=A0A7S2IF45_9STRA